MSKFTETYPQFGQLDSKNKFLFMMSQENEELTKVLTQNVHKWMMKRLEFKNNEQQELIQYIVIFTNV